MRDKIIHFIKYHNAFNIVFITVFLGAGVSFAVSPDLRDSVYVSQETIVSVDNSLVVSTDLDNFDFNLIINSITEDEANYYAVYSYQTLVIENGAWQNKAIEKTLKVSKESLDGKDLGLYMAEELGEDINAERYYLKRVQKLERENGASQKIVAVEYSGLIGKFLDPEEMVIDGYSPVIPEETPTPTPEPAPASSSATPEPTPTPATSPVVSASPASSPSITPEPTPHPEVTPVPFSPGEVTGQAPLTSSSPEPAPASSSATPLPEPSPSASPTVELSPSSTPTLTPESTTTPTPVPTPESTPEPQPEVSPTPEETPPL